MIIKVVLSLAVISFVFSDETTIESPEEPTSESPEDIKDEDMCPKTSKVFESKLRCKSSMDCFKTKVREAAGEYFCNLETKYCCKGLGSIPKCPDQITILHGEPKCSKESDGHLHCKQMSAICYMGYCCPMTIIENGVTTISELPYITQMYCNPLFRLPKKYKYMFCDPMIGRIVVMGRLDLNKNLITKRWKPCSLNEDCGMSRVCVNEDMCRRRCYDNPLGWNDEIFDTIILSFVVPMIFLALIIVATIYYLD